MARASTFSPVSTKTFTSTGTANVVTATPPDGTSAAYISAETNDARLTFDGSDPSAGTGSHKIPKDQPPILLLVTQPIKFVSTASAPSVLQITWLE